MPLRENGACPRRALYQRLRVARLRGRRLYPGPIHSLFRSGMDNVAFRNQDGSVAMVLINRNNTAKTVCIAYGGETFSDTVPAGSAMTFCWQG